MMWLCILEAADLVTIPPKQFESKVVPNMTTIE